MEYMALNGFLWILWILPNTVKQTNGSNMPQTRHFQNVNKLKNALSHWIMWQVKMTLKGAAQSLWFINSTDSQNNI